MFRISSIILIITIIGIAFFSYQTRIQKPTPVEYELPHIVDLKGAFELTLYRPGSFPLKNPVYDSYVEESGEYDLKESDYTFRYPLGKEKCKSFKGSGCQFSGEIKFNKNNFMPGAYIYTLIKNEVKHIGFFIIPPQKKSPNSKVAIIYPDYTYQAYNKTGAKNLYNQDQKKSEIRVNRFRPTYKNGWYHNPNTLTIEPFLKEYFKDLNYDILSNHSVHRNPESLKNYNLIIIFGHDEYWTEEIFYGFKEFLNNGGNLLNMSGNSAWWKTKIEGSEMIVDKRTKAHKEPGCQGNWFRCGPEESLIGVSFRFAGYPLSKKFKTRDSLLQANAPQELLNLDPSEYETIEILNHEHPLFNGINVNLKRFGEGGALAIEFDGAPLNKENEIDFNYAPTIPKTVKPLGAAWSVRGGIRKSAVVIDYQYSDKSRVISLASVGWLKAINIKNKEVIQVTQNAINLLLND